MKITLCGSMAFLERMRLIERELLVQGHEVKLPVWSEDEVEAKKLQIKFFEFEKQQLPWADWMSEYKGRAIREHYAKIEWSEAILIVNEEKRGIAGYIGGNTLMEMGLAFYLKKTIYLLHPIPEVGYRDEILGMQPRILHGDLVFSA